MTTNFSPNAAKTTHHSNPQAPRSSSSISKSSSRTSWDRSYRNISNNNKATGRRMRVQARNNRWISRHCRTSTVLSRFPTRENCQEARASPRRTCSSRRRNWTSDRSTAARTSPTQRSCARNCSLPYNTSTTTRWSTSKIPSPSWTTPISSRSSPPSHKPRPKSKKKTSPKAGSSKKPSSSTFCGKWSTRSLSPQGTWRRLLYCWIRWGGVSWLMPWGSCIVGMMLGVRWWGCLLTAGWSSRLISIAIWTGWTKEKMEGDRQKITYSITRPLVHRRNLCKNPS